MAIKRPFGVTIIAALVTCIGGALTLVVIIEVIDVVNLLGIRGVAIDTPVTFLGFLLYGIAPLFFYTVGLGLFFSKRWAYVLFLRIFPALFLLIVLNTAANIVRIRYYFMDFNIFQLFILRPQTFVGFLLGYLVILWPLLSYLRLPYIALYFHFDKK